MTNFNWNWQVFISKSWKNYIDISSLINIKIKINDVYETLKRFIYIIIENNVEMLIRNIKHIKKYYIHDKIAICFVN